jgi:hypothetical protein
MYSNSVKRNPIFHKKRAPKVGIEHFSVGCVTESTTYDTIPKPIHRTKYVQQNYDIRNNTARAILEYNEALNYEKNANLRLFSDINKNSKTSQELPAPSIHRRAFYNPPLRNNNTIQETGKPRIIKEHIGATNTQFPTTRIGQEILRQKALMNITELPNIMKSLITSVTDLKQIRNVKDGIVDKTEKVEEPSVVERKNTAPIGTSTSSVTPSKTTPRDDYDDVQYIPRLEDSSGDEAYEAPAEDAQELHDGEKEVYLKTLKELNRIAYRIQKSKTITDVNVDKLIDLNIITRETSSDLDLTQRNIEAYSQLLRDELAK